MYTVQFPLLQSRQAYCLYVQMTRNFTRFQQRRCLCSTNLAQTIASIPRSLPPVTLRIAPVGQCLTSLGHTPGQYSRQSQSPHQNSHCEDQYSLYEVHPEVACCINVLVRVQLEDLPQGKIKMSFQIYVKGTRAVILVGDTHVQPESHKKCVWYCSMTSWNQPLFGKGRQQYMCLYYCRGWISRGRGQLSHSAVLSLL